MEAQRSRLPQHIPYRDSRLTFLLQVHLTDSTASTCNLLACLHAQHAPKQQTGTTLSCRVQDDCRIASEAAQRLCTAHQQRDLAHGHGLKENPALGPKHRARSEQCDCTDRCLQGRALDVTLGPACRSPWVAMQKQ